MRLLAKAMRFSIKFSLFRLLTFRKNKELVQLIKRIQSESGFMMWPDEMSMLYTTAFALKNKKGDFAEVGVSTGGSAKLISEAKGGKNFHLFDTFEGLPEPGEQDKHLHRGQYTCSLPAVKEYLKSYTAIHYYPGLFPQTSKPVENKTFSFVHLDVDLYQSTLDAIRFFYPRLETGGMLISHDYSTVPGVRKAFDEFFIETPEVVVELPTSQCLVVKI